MIDSNYLNIPGDLELIPNNLLYSSPLDSSPSSSLNQSEFYDYLGNYDNQNNLNNNNNLIDFCYTDLTNNTVNINNPNPLDHYYDNDYNGDNNDGYNLTNLTNQLVENQPSQSISSTFEALSPIVTSSSSLTSQVNHRYSSGSSISSASLSSTDYSSSHHNRPLSNTSVDSIDANRSIDGCKRDLIKATLNFAIKSRRRSRGLGDIEFKHVKNQNQRPSSWADEDDEKKMSRRERNRIAARKCRKNRKLKYIGLNKTMENLDNANNNLKEQLDKLERESGKLEDLLTSHRSQCYLVSWSSQPMLTSASSSVSSSSPNHLLTINNKNSNYSQSGESHGFISYINQSQLWPNALQ